MPATAAAPHAPYPAAPPSAAHETPPAYAPPGAMPPQSPAATPPAPAWGAPAPGGPPAAAPAMVNTYGGFWRRFWALVIDSMLIYVVTLPAKLAVGLPWAFRMRDVSSFDPAQMGSLIGAGLLLNLATLVLTWGYFAWMHSSERQATLGMMALGLRITDLDGRRISFARATGRYFASLLSALIFLIGYLIQPFTARRQALHDMLAGTLVLCPRFGPPGR
ncbi:MAG TPA: RDD family protein [Candidatus Eisenbacteria bacterium]|nr:RDD family protein [Candidatus Eisenbacteria bacterium]